jgi:Family of unknown function (DUF6152)
MNRRQFLIATSLGALAHRAHAHHGWSSFDQTQPLYLQGVVEDVEWANPHVEIDIQIPANLKLPAGLATRTVPAQQVTIDTAALFAKTQLPTRKDRDWEIELAPLTRMEAWKIEPIKKGEAIEVVGFTFPMQEGEAILRAEFLFRGGKVYGLRSSPV